MDLNEVKRIDYSVKFWPVYARDKAYTSGHSRGRAHTEGESWGIAVMSGTSSMSAFGSSTPDSPFPPMGAGSHFQSSGAGSMEASSFMDGGMRADTESESWSESEADIPIYHPVPFLEGTETPWSLEEQRQRYADALRLQLARHCFIRTPDGLCRPILVPRVLPVPLSAKRVAAYQAQIDRKVGALTADQVDAIIEARRRQIEQRARAHFDGTREEPVHSPAHDQQPQRINLDDAVRPPEEGPAEPEGQVSPLPGKRRTR
jgi:hypothetical protein